MHNDKIPLIFIIFIACLSVGGLVSTDIFLPALGRMSVYYHVSKSDIQNVIALFLFAIAIGQLIYGPISDSLGRKKTLLLGLFLWLLTTIGIIYTTNISSLLFLRFLQGMGACSGIVLSRAIVNDLLDKESAGHIYLIIFPFVGMSPAIAPLIGGSLLKYFEWQSSFVFLIAFVFLTILLCLFFFEESLPEKERREFNFSGIVNTVFQVLKNKQFIFYALVPCFAYAAYFAYLSESPFFLTNLGMVEENISYSYICLSFAYVLGNIVAKRFTKLFSLERTLKIGYFIFVCAGFLFLVQIYLSVWPLVTSLVAISLLTFSNGFLLPLGTALAISSHSQASGTASGVMGFLQLGSAAVSAALIGKISGHQPHIVAILLALLCIVGFTLYIKTEVKYIS
ncbi:multidrug resistance transporter, Bcr/CflA family [Bartonella australis AUST/NH1]|uniref:Bcr/CflA family efflux transporter n=1 Tax=Bartonella australis (strain Aust/NH1) TaxID=1094489 RepID=M1N4P5_BARAA|nr:multidrug effflux MFS transporter [Bartonella australis]AGF74869.1 multidrug resistance transporter, Bcr/CflA family [Bartonella australis AUST/NH1]